MHVDYAPSTKQPWNFLLDRPRELLSRLLLPMVRRYLHPGAWRLANRQPCLSKDFERTLTYPWHRQYRYWWWWHGPTQTNSWLRSVPPPAHVRRLVRQPVKSLETRFYRSCRCISRSKKLVEMRQLCFTTMIIGNKRAFNTLLTVWPRYSTCWFVGHCRVPLPKQGEYSHQNIWLQLHHLQAAPTNIGTGLCLPHKLRPKLDRK